MGNSYDVVLCSQTRILGDSIRRQIPGIRDTIDASAAALDAELRCLGGSVPSDREALMHEVLISCGRFEKDFGKVLDGGRGGKFLLTLVHAIGVTSCFVHRRRDGSGHLRGEAGEFAAFAQPPGVLQREVRQIRHRRHGWVPAAPRGAGDGNKEVDRVGSGAFAGTRRAVRQVRFF